MAKRPHMARAESPATRFEPYNPVGPFFDRLNRLLADAGYIDGLGAFELPMTFLSDSERAALATRSTQRVKRAEALVNPASGLANDYLNLFNEIIMLVEQLPIMPDLFDEIQNWHPMSYRDYFRRSVLPGRGSALEAYDRLDPRFRRQFEAIVEELDRRATGAVAAVRKQFKTADEPTALAVICERAGATIRETLVKATMLVNHGKIVACDEVQARADSVMRFGAAGF